VFCRDRLTSIGRDSPDQIKIYCDCHQKALERMDYTAEENLRGDVPDSFIHKGCQKVAGIAD
jgi:hypothetical protein